MKSGKSCLVILALLIGLKAYPQISSPYSSNGIGEVLFQGLPQNFAMGELGIGTPSYWHINIMNPAQLTYNPLSCFEVGLEADFRKFKTEDEAIGQNGLGLRYLSMSFPIMRQSRWVTAFSLLPLSSANYHTSNYTDLGDGYAAKSDYYGDGGLTQLTWGNGFRLFKTLAIGINASYIFGAINNETTIKMGIDSLIRDKGFFPEYVIAYQEIDSYSDFNLTIGASYKVTLAERKYLNLGAIYRLSNELTGTKESFYERQTESGNSIGGTQIVLEDNQKLSHKLPQTYGLGVSFEKSSHYKIGIDVSQQLWTGVDAFEAGEIYRDATNIALGGEYIPDYQSISSYFARTIYRLGVSYKQSPYILNGTKIDDFGINFGASFPVGVASSLETGFKYGIRGTTRNGLIRESYFQFVLGATINDKWFEKRRYD